MAARPARTAGFQPPTVEWAISKHVVPGEPLFVEYKVQNPNDETIIVKFQPSREAWFTASFGGKAIPPALAVGRRRAAIDDNSNHGLCVNLIEPHSFCREVVTIPLPPDAQAPSGCSVTLAGTLEYREGQVWSDVNTAEPPVATQATLNLSVEPVSDEALAAAADRLGRAWIDRSMAPAEGIDGYYPVKAWLDMPIGPSMPCWRRYLLSGKCDGSLPRISALLCTRTEPEMQKLVSDIASYVHGLGNPRLEERLRQFVSAAKSPPNRVGD